MQFRVFSLATLEIYDVTPDVFMSYVPTFAKSGAPSCSTPLS